MDLQTLMTKEVSNISDTNIVIGNWTSFSYIKLIGGIIIFIVGIIWIFKYANKEGNNNILKLISFLIPIIRNNNVLF